MSDIDDYDSTKRSKNPGVVCNFWANLENYCVRVFLCITLQSHSCPSNKCFFVKRYSSFCQDHPSVWVGKQCNPPWELFDFHFFEQAKQGRREKAEAKFFKLSLWIFFRTVSPFWQAIGHFPRFWLALLAQYPDARAPLTDFLAYIWVWVLSFFQVTWHSWNSQFSILSAI